MLTSHLSADKHLNLALYVKAMEHMLGSDGAFTSTQVFDEVPPVFTTLETPKNSPTIDERAQIGFELRKAMEEYMKNALVGCALRHTVPHAASATNEKQDEVLVWRESQVKNRKGKRVGTYLVEGWDHAKKLVYIHDTQIGPAIRFNVVYVKKKFRPEASSHAHTQMDDDFERHVFICKVPSEIDLEPDQCLQVVKPNYGLSECEELWQKTVDGYYRKDLIMSPLVSDQKPLTVWIDGGNLMGLRSFYVDDLIRAGTAKFHKKCEKTKRRFDTIEKSALTFYFIGFTVERPAGRKLSLQQSE